MEVRERIRMKGLAGCVGSKISYYFLDLYGPVKFLSGFLSGFDLGFYKKVGFFLILEQPSALSPTESIRYIHS